ncbi:hypothetical protein FACS1894125_2430 [Actinomycetota bacterium]|nr:hypothetical protein FACS1894125_2430 [Actinomycetota bacterium]
MIELEILVEVYDDYAVVESILAGFDFVETRKVIDTYFFDPQRVNLLPNSDGVLLECLRLRDKEGDFTLTYKNDVYDGKTWLYSNENEIHVSDKSQTSLIFEKIGLKEMLEINNERKYYRYEDYEIVLEKVANLGTFLEVELKRKISESEAKLEKQRIRDFIHTLNIQVSEELNEGKPQLFLKRHKLLEKYIVHKEAK